MTSPSGHLEKRRSRIRPFLRNFLLVCVSSVLTFFVAELGFRALTNRKYHHTVSLVPHEKLGYVMPSGLKERTFRAHDYQMTISISRHGFRVSKYRKPSKYKFIVIGDSYTFGWGVDDDETYPAYMNRYKDRFENLQDMEFINIAQRGWGTSHYRSALEYFLDLYGNDVSGVLIMHSANDFGDNVRRAIAPRESAITIRNLILSSEIVNYFYVKGMLYRLEEKIGIFIHYWKTYFNRSVSGEQGSSKDRAENADFDRGERRENEGFFQIEGVRIMKQKALGFRRFHEPEYDPQIERLQRKIYADIAATARGKNLPLYNSTLSVAGKWARILAHMFGDSYIDVRPVIRECASPPCSAYWNRHSGGHLSSTGNEALAMELLRVLNQRHSVAGRP